MKTNSQPKTILQALQDFTYAFNSAEEADNIGLRDEYENACTALENYSKEHPENYVMLTEEFGSKMYIGGSIDSTHGIGITDKENEAEKWSYVDTLSTAKLNYHKSITGYKELKFIKI